MSQRIVAIHVQPNMLPYYKFQKIKPFYGVPHTLEYRNGYRVASAPKPEIGCARVSELNKAMYCSWFFFNSSIFSRFADNLLDIMDLITAIVAISIKIHN